MKTHSVRLAIAVAASVMPSVAWAQHEGHQAGAAQALSPELAQCLRVQPVIANIITGAMSRAEAARLSNSPTDLRAAVDGLEAALRDIRAQSGPCSTAAAASDPHADHSMATTQPPATASPAQSPAGANDPHAGHAMPSGTPGPKGTTGTKPAPNTPSKPAAADPHAGHSSGQPTEQQKDPVNGLMVDPAKALKATYEGQTYYFSSEQSRREFLANPAKFAKKPKG